MVSTSSCSISHTKEGGVSAHVLINPWLLENAPVLAELYAVRALFAHSTTNGRCPTPCSNHALTPELVSLCCTVISASHLLHSRVGCTRYKWLAQICRVIPHSLTADCITTTTVRDFEYPSVMSLDYLA